MRLPDELWEKLKRIENKSQFIREAIAEKLGTDYSILKPELQKEIERIVERKLGWNKLK